jgi:hypothetical protein
MFELHIGKVVRDCHHQANFFGAMKPSSIRSSNLSNTEGFTSIVRRKLFPFLDSSPLVIFLSLRYDSVDTILPCFAP